MKQLKTKILDNKKIAKGFYKMRIESTYLARAITPGQFLEVRCSDEVKPFLRRPFSVHRILNGAIEILYEVAGKGTRILSRKKKGEYLDIIGPLGNGFLIDKQTMRDARRTTHVLVAGGIGAAPLAALAERLAQSSKLEARNKGNKICVLIGAKKRSHILCEKDFNRLGCKVLVSTEDGSKGGRGFITSVLKGFLRNAEYGIRATVYACGPAGMLKEVARIARGYQIPCQVSLEERMACGVGVCLGCPVKVRKSFTKYEIRNTNDEYKMVCKDGPVFNAEEIAW